jgi:hypothetical protein
LATLAAQPAVASARPFRCLQSQIETRKKNRVAVLPGPDWILESSIIPGCFAERDVTFSTQLGEHLLAAPFTARTRLWIARDHGTIHIRIVKSSGSEKQDMIAMSFATNHKCIGKSSAAAALKVTRHWFKWTSCPITASWAPLFFFHLQEC